LPLGKREELRRLSARPVGSAESSDGEEKRVGKREHYEPGTFCWVDLATTDPEGAKAFYGGLFGWEAEDTVGGDGGPYTMLGLDGDHVAGLYELEAGRREMGIPPHWFSYVSVESADATAARAGELGGQNFGGARDAAEMGRMAVVVDPSGAAFGLWEERSFSGARRVNDPGCLAWNDLQTRDAQGAAGFYSGLFGWEMEIMGEANAPDYVVIQNTGRANGGIMPMSEAHGDAPPHWLPYFAVRSCDETVGKAKESGGAVLAGTMDVGNGKIAVLGDPQGAVFALFEGETDD
jgi:predicted enzyme related to lactoylglutathione lyase